ncbi:kelch-like protein 6 isoform X1 [Pecten maximus]|uniref:kelch-like protein 6 isoform X1 n=1 Tax=Pecten maximus TaxID=6579 RepID=UPI001458102A|nr:kelch-like protein 6 isoform X1 [Pecten maximus]
MMMAGQHVRIRLVQYGPLQPNEEKTRRAIVAVLKKKPPEPTMATEQIYTRSLTEGLRRLLTTGEHNDVTILVGTKTFHCHRLILVALSSYFEAMFNSGMKESISGEIKFPDMNEDQFEMVLGYMYSGKINLVTENAMDILDIASILQIKSLQRICEEFLLPHLTKENCIKIWKISVLHSCDVLSEKSFQMMVKNFQDICKAEEFNELEAKELATILKEDDLNVESEDKLCDIVLKWIKKDKDVRTKDVGLLFENIRLPFLKPEYLLNLEEVYKFLKDDPNCAKCIDFAKKYHLLPARQQEMYSNQTRFRSTADSEEVLVLLGGCLTTSPPYSRSLKVPCYNFRKRVWYEIAPLPFDPGIEFATCTYKSDIYITGGGSMQNCLLKYDYNKNKWTQLCTMKSGRRRHAMVAVTGYLYVMGGYDNKLADGSRMISSIERYDIREDAWEHVADLIIPVSSFSAAVMSDVIYMFGGEMNDRKDTSVIQCYDTRLMTTSKMVCKILHPCKLTRAVICGKRVFLIFFDGQVMEFSRHTQDNTRGTCRMVGQLTAFQRIHFGVIHFQGNVLVLGGEIDTNTLCDDMIMFDPTTSGCKKLLDTLPAPRLIDSCVKTAVKKKFLQIPEEPDPR